MNNENIYKHSVDSGFKKELQADLEKHLSKFNDPVVLGELLYKLLEERENTNRILKNILARLDAIEQGKKDATEEILLPEIDEQIIDFVKEQKKVTAEEVRTRFSYKGTNAASARLNRLYELGLLKKKQVGKKVFFLSR